MQYFKTINAKARSLALVKSCFWNSLHEIKNPAINNILIMSLMWLANGENKVMVTVNITNSVAKKANAFDLIILSILKWLIEFRFLIIISSSFIDLSCHWFFILVHNGRVSAVVAIPQGSYALYSLLATVFLFALNLKTIKPINAESKEPTSIPTFAESM